MTYPEDWIQAGMIGLVVIRWISPFLSEQSIADCSRVHCGPERSVAPMGCQRQVLQKVCSGGEATAASLLPRLQISGLEVTVSCVCLCSWRHVRAASIWSSTTRRASSRTGTKSSSKPSSSWRLISWYSNTPHSQTHPSCRQTSSTLQSVLVLLDLPAASSTIHDASLDHLEEQAGIYVVLSASPLLYPTGGFTGLAFLTCGVHTWTRPFLFLCTFLWLPHTGMQLFVLTVRFLVHFKPFFQLCDSFWDQIWN